MPTPTPHSEALLHPSSFSFLAYVCCWLDFTVLRQHGPSAQAPLPALHRHRTGVFIAGNPIPPPGSGCVGLDEPSSMTLRWEGRVTHGGDTRSGTSRDGERGSGFFRDSQQPQLRRDGCRGTLGCHACSTALLWWPAPNPRRGQGSPASRSVQHPSRIRSPRDLAGPAVPARPVGSPCIHWTPPCVPPHACRPPRAVRQGLSIPPPPNPLPPDGSRQQAGNVRNAPQARCPR